jgi:hypothetical protein
MVDETPAQQSCDRRFWALVKILLCLLGLPCFHPRGLLVYSLGESHPESGRRILIDDHRRAAIPRLGGHFQAISKMKEAEAKNPLSSTVRHYGCCWAIKMQPRQ